LNKWFPDGEFKSNKNTINLFQVDKADYIRYEDGICCQIAEGTG
jgi:hypothetical protein